MNKAHTPRRSRAMLRTLPLSFSSSIYLSFLQKRTLTIRGPAVLISREPSGATDQANKLLVLSKNNKPSPVGKRQATFSGLKITFPDPQSREAFIAAAAVAVKQSSSGMDRYTVHRRLGSGAVGTVYLVRRRSDGRRFAMKTIAKTDTYMSDSRLESLVSERTALAEAAQRGSPFIVRLVDAFETDRRLCFVTELAEYGDLQGVLKRVEKRRLSERAARIMFAEALMGLEETHRMGFLYRDMKPGNLLLNKNGHVKVADFGLAKRMQVEYDGSSVSSVSSSDGSEDEEPFRLVGRTTSFVGTRRYMSPEHLSVGERRKRGYGAAADVWALGVTLYVMLTGEYPFGRGLSSRDTASMFHAISNEELRFPGWLGKEVRSLLKGMLERDALERLELDEIKEHVWMKKVDWDALRCNAEKDTAQEEILEELQQGGLVVSGKEEDIECNIEGVSVGSSMSCGSTGICRSRPSNGLDRIQLVGFGYANWGI